MTSVYSNPHTDIQRTKPLWQLSTKDKHLEVKFYDRNQVDDKIAWGLDGGILSIHSSSVY